MGHVLRGRAKMLLVTTMVAVMAANGFLLAASRATEASHAGTVGGWAPALSPVHEVVGEAVGSIAGLHHDPALAAPARPARARVAATAAAPSGAVDSVTIDPANAWAVIVGIGTYDSPTHPTYGGLGDVDAFHRLLNQAGWPDSHILILTDQAATAGGIIQGMRWLVAHSSPTSFSVFHYSGHVYQASGHEFLWGVDNNFIRNDEFGSDLQGLQGRAWVDVSGCESAGFDQGISSSSRFFTASSMADQKSYELPDAHESVWTNLSVQQAMREHQAGNGPVSIQQAVRWAEVMAPRETANQVSHGPQQPYAMGGDGEWYLGPPMVPTAAPEPAAGSSPPQPVPSAPATRSPAAPGVPSGTDGCARLTFGLLRCGS